ncbi:hypothetical protein C8R43DRAFT_1021321 [Mycena crocata]|nr:hypothetical protein C8R43DRAFT_1021321 [Mycena crocata]
MSTRLGLTPSPAEAVSFASSIAHWPLIDDAVEVLQILRSRIPALVALADADHSTLLKSTAFSFLAPYFTEVFTWDASHTYRPFFNAFNPAFLFHDNMGVLRRRRLFVSSKLICDLEPAAELQVPVVWMRYPASLASNLSVDEASFSWKVCDGLRDLASGILEY